MLKVSSCGRPKSVVQSLSRVVCHQHLPCGHSRSHISSSIDMKFGQNVCLDKISDEFEFGSPGVINQVTMSK